MTRFIFRTEDPELVDLTNTVVEPVDNTGFTLEDGLQMMQVVGTIHMVAAEQDELTEWKR